MKDKFFLDTNIIVNLFDKHTNQKNQIALELLKEALQSGTGVLSFQVIQEFCNVALNKFKKPMSLSDCREFINRFLFPVCEVFPGMELYNTALDIREKSGYNFYDALIVAAALHSKCTTIYTEDIQDGANIMGVTIKNPF